MGDGNFAVVYRSKLRGSDREYAIKVVDKSKMKVKKRFFVKIILRYIYLL